MFKAVVRAQMLPLGNTDRPKLNCDHSTIPQWALIATALKLLHYARRYDVEQPLRHSGPRFLIPLGSEIADQVTNMKVESFGSKEKPDDAYT